METDLDRTNMRVEFLKEQLTAANKAIVALSEALEFYGLAQEIEYKTSEYNGDYDHYGIIVSDEGKTARNALTTNAPAIEKARGG